MPRFRLASTLPTLIVISTGSACRDGSLVQDPAAPNPSAMTAPVAALLSRDGRFPAARPPGTSDERTQQEAERIASAVVRNFGEFNRNRWSREAGRSVDVGALRTCARTDYAQSAYSEMPAGASGRFRQLNGSIWLVRFCDSGNVPAVEVTVPAVRDPQFPDAIFGSEDTGVDPSALSLSPENAVTAAAALARSRVRTAPILSRVGNGWSAHVVSWIMEITANADDAQGTTRGGRAVVFGQYAAERSTQLLPLESVTAEFDTLPAFDGRGESRLVVRRTTNAPKLTTRPVRNAP